MKERTTPYIEALRAAIAADDHDKVHDLVIINQPDNLTPLDWLFLGWGRIEYKDGPFMETFHMLDSNGPTSPNERAAFRAGIVWARTQAGKLTHSNLGHPDRDLSQEFLGEVYPIARYHPDAATCWVARQAVRELTPLAAAKMGLTPQG
jgi:hypothetical protein